MSTLYGWLRTICKDVQVDLQYVHESHVEWEGETGGRRYNVTSTILYGPGYVFDARQTIDEVMEKAVSVYVTVTELSSGRRYHGELLGDEDTVKVDYANVSFLARK